MLIGTFTPRLDEKGRLILPAKFREELAGGLVMTRGHEKCLFVFPMAEFVTLHNTLRAAPLTSREARDFNRVLLSGAHDEIPDKQGRVTIPATLRQWAGLERELAVVGTGNKLEVWDS
ncbi:MAG TPA: cell division/cell wall cluster transcriptional repressor MraZ, partial [Micrococcales bacterium]|nr:cell division/cell wall cluster transcriptional repressor MraZ [Micrococcales bacterium]